MSDVRRIGKNSLFLFVLTISNYFVGLLLFPFISRVLSVESFGFVGFAMAYVLPFQIIVEYGFMISATARISQSRNDKEKISEILSSTMLAKIILAALATVMFAISAIFVGPLRDHTLFMTLFFLSAAVAAMTPDFYFRGIEKMRAIAMRAVFTKLFSVLLIVVLVHGDEDIVIVPASLLAGNIIAAGLAFYSIKRDGVNLRLVKIKSAWIDIKAGVFLFLSRIAVAINQALGMFMLGFKYSPASQELGMFAAATRIASAGEMMIVPVSDSLYPHMLNRKDYRLFRKVYVVGVVAWFLACTFVFVFAETICTIVLGPAYASASDLLRILLLGTFMAFSSNLFGYNALAPIGLVKHANIALLLSLGINTIAFAVLYLSGKISLTSVAIVVTLSNVFIFGYRAAILFRNRNLVKNIMHQQVSAS